MKINILDSYHFLLFTVSIKTGTTEMSDISYIFDFKNETIDVKRMLVKALWVLVFVLFSQRCVVANKMVEKVIKIQNLADTAIKFNAINKDYVVVLGKSGTGKTPFVKWLATDNSLLQSIRVDNNRFLMNNTDGKIGSSKFVSATVYPDLYVSPDGTNYYDFPGFLDTRGAHYDLAIAYLIKRVADDAQRIKLLLLVSYDSVRSSATDRDGFSNALKSLIEFIPNVEKFRNSLALIITGVYLTEGINEFNRTAIIGDDQVIEEVGASIREFVKSVLDNKDDDEELTPVQQKQLSLLGALTGGTNNTDLSKIGIFRYPDRTGKYSELDILKAGKSRIEHIVGHVLSFTNSSASDFGHSISPDSKRLVHKIFNAMLNNEIAPNLANISREITEVYYRKFCDSEANTTRLIEMVPKGLAALRSIDAQESLTFLNQSIKAIESFKSLGINVDVARAIRQIGYLEFLKSSTNDNPRSYVSAQLQNNVSNAIANITIEFERHLNATIETLLGKRLPIAVTNITREIDRFYEGLQNKTFDMNVVHDRIQHGHDALSTIDVEDQTYLSMVEHLVDAANDLNIGVSLQTTRNIKIDIESVYVFIEAENKSRSLAIAADQRNLVKSIVKKLNRATQFYGALISVYAELVNIATYNVTELKEARKKCANATKIDYIGFDKLLANSPAALHLLLSSDVGRTEDALQAYELRAIERLLDALDATDVDVFCAADGVVRIAGTIVKLSDAMATNKNCWLAAKRIEIFALETVIFDMDLHKPGCFLKIVAPVWKIVGTRNINLNGTTGEHGNAGAIAAANGKINGTRDGQNGLDGSPGGAGGTFFGLGKVFINGASLRIDANGGRGGDGQNGGNGTIFFIPK